MRARFHTIGRYSQADMKSVRQHRHGLFNSWILDPQYSGQKITLSYKAQRASMFLNVFAAVLQAAALLVAFLWRARNG